MLFIIRSETTRPKGRVMMGPFRRTLPYQLAWSRDEPTSSGDTYLSAHALQGSRQRQEQEEDKEEVQGKLHFDNSKVKLLKLLLLNEIHFVLGQTFLLIKH